MWRKFWWLPPKKVEQHWSTKLYITCFFQNYNCILHVFFRITQETEWAWQRKLLESGAPKIDRENVEDELDRGDCLTIGTEEKFENENEEGGMYFYWYKIFLSTPGVSKIINSYSQNQQIILFLKWRPDKNWAWFY